MQENSKQPENHDPLAELRDLLAAFEANELTEEQDARLQQLVVESEEAQRCYLQYMFMYGGMYRHARRSRTVGSDRNSPSANNAIFPLLDIESDILSSGDVNELGSEKTSAWGGFLGYLNFSFIPGLIMVLALTLCLSAVVILPIYWSTQPTDPKWNVVAMVSKTVDCQWAQEAKQEGDYLKAGQVLDLEVGLAEIEFSSGAKLVLQGPARFIVTGYNRSRLDQGRLAAMVPEKAKGFVVQTPGMNVVDLGTEFGVAVGTNHKADVHVFKGVVEVTAATRSGEKKTIQLHRHEAIEYDKTIGEVLPMPVDTKKFVRNLHQVRGITTDLQVVNPSFEVPDIRTVPEYQPKHGDTQFRAISGWKVSDPNQALSRIVMYQISPYDSPNPSPLYDVGPGATDGRQVVTICLRGDKSSSFKRKERCEWLYQSLGTVTTADIGKKLKLTVDAGCRQGLGAKDGSWSVFAGFALEVTTEGLGTVIEKANYSPQEVKGSEEDKEKGLKPLEVSIPITVELVGQELFVFAGASDSGSDSASSQYHFDNVRIVVED